MPDEVIYSTASGETLERVDSSLVPAEHSKYRHNNILYTVIDVEHRIDGDTHIAEATVADLSAGITDESDEKDAERVQFA